MSDLTFDADKNFIKETKAIALMQKADMQGISPLSDRLERLVSIIEQQQNQITELQERVILAEKSIPPKDLIWITREEQSKYVAQEGKLARADKVIDVVQDVVVLDNGDLKARGIILDVCYAIKLGEALKDYNNQD